MGYKILKKEVKIGCHTWCYKKINRTQQQANEIFISITKEFIDSLDINKLSGNEKEKSIQMSFIYQYVDMIPAYKRQIEMVKKGFCQRAVWNRQPELSIYIENKGFYVEEGIHDPFRIFGYPNDILFSYKECIDYITKYEKENNTKVELWNNGNTLKEFWQNNPDGLIKFG